jgi:hypothetical protein
MGDLVLRAKSTHQIDNNADEENQADAAAAECRASDVEAAAAEQEKQDDYQ